MSRWLSRGRLAHATPPEINPSLILIFDPGGVVDTCDPRRGRFYNLILTGGGGLTALPPANLAVNPSGSCWAGHLLFGNLADRPSDLVLRAGAARLVASSRSLRIRSKSTLAGSSLGSCGTNFPSKAFFRMLWRRASACSRLWAMLSSSLSQTERRVSISETIACCSLKVAGIDTGNPESYSEIY